MNVYRVSFENNTPISAVPDKELFDCEMELEDNMRKVKWFAVECRDEKTAIEVADLVVKRIWTERK